MAKAQGGGGKGKQQESKKGKPRSAGKSQAKIARFYANPTRSTERKLRRVLKRNGPQAAKEWAELHGVPALWNKITKEGTVDRRIAGAQRRAAARLERSELKKGRAFAAAQALNPPRPVRQAAAW